MQDLHGLQATQNHLAGYAVAYSSASYYLEVLLVILQDSQVCFRLGHVVGVPSPFVVFALLCLGLTQPATRKRARKPEGCHRQCPG